MADPQKHWLVSLVLVVIVMYVVALVIGLWLRAGGVVGVLIAYMAVLAYLGVGVMMAGERARRVMGKVPLVSAGTVLMTFALVAWAPFSPWTGWTLEALRGICLGCIIGVFILATLGWVRYAKQGRGCLNYLDTPTQDPAKENHS